jgi:hypothetical protein
VAPAAGEKAAGVLNLKKFKAPVAKDTMGVVTLADLLGYVSYIAEMFKMNDKDASGLDAVCDTLKGMIAVEAGEPEEKELSHTAEDLAKVFGGELAKAMAPVMGQVGDLAKAVETLTSDMAVIKGTKVSPRPQGAIAVDKVFATPGAGGAKDAVSKRAELEAISKEIDEFATKMQSEMISDPSKRGQFEKEGMELH